VNFGQPTLKKISKDNEYNGKRFARVRIAKGRRDVYSFHGLLALRLAGYAIGISDTSFRVARGKV
jgi:hypothetical protein